MLWTARSRHGVVCPSAGSQEELLLHGSGYLLAHTPTAVTDWNDREHVAETWYPELLQAVGQMLPGFEWSCGHRAYSGSGSRPPAHAVRREVRYGKHGTDEPF